MIPKLFRRNQSGSKIHCDDGFQKFSGVNGQREHCRKSRGASGGAGHRRVRVTGVANPRHSAEPDFADHSLVRRDSRGFERRRVSRVDLAISRAKHQRAGVGGGRPQFKTAGDGCAKGRQEIPHPDLVDVALTGNPQSLADADSSGFLGARCAVVARLDASPFQIR